MSPVPASAITIADGEITIDAELLAPKLGLSSNTEHPSLLGRFAGDATGPDARVFHAVEFNAVLALWAPTSDSRATAPTTRSPRR